MGSVFGEQSFMTEEDRELFESDGLNVAVAASASGFGVSGAAEGEVQVDDALATTFQSRTFNRAAYSRGSPPPADGKQETWVNNVVNSPSPIAIELDRIDELDLPVSLAVLSNLELAIDTYCQTLVEANEIATCDPLDDPDELANACQTLTDEREIEACPETRFSDYTTPIEGNEEIEVPGVASPPNVCAPGEYLAAIQVEFEFDIGLTNLELTCSDGEVMFATNNELGALQNLVTCSQGFDAARGLGNVNKRGPNIGRYHTVVLETSCENNPAFVPSGGVTYSDTKRTPNIFCANNEKVVGMQVEETADQDEGIVRFRFVCRTIA